MKKINVIEFFGEPLNYGGQEAFIINIYSKIDKSKFEFTFITPFECKNEKLKKMIKENGDHLIADNQKFDSKFRKKSIIKTAKKYINNNYSIIHIHSGSIFTLYNVAKISKERQVNKVIVHSHATGINNIKYRLIKKITDKSFSKYADEFLACSEDAAKWKFPKKIIKNNKYIIIKNGIDLEKFKFNKNIRNEYRKKLKVEDKIVMCNVGRFSKEKNQDFVIDVFHNYQKTNNAFLMLIGGNGDNEEEINKKIEQLNLKDKVLILKNIDNVSDYLQASDVFLFPSLFEGLGIVAIESQTIGLPIICSENIPKDVYLTNICRMHYINENVNIWCDEIDDLRKMDRVSNIDVISSKGYNIYSSVKNIEKIYIGEKN